MFAGTGLPTFKAMTNRRFPVPPAVRSLRRTVRGSAAFISGGHPLTPGAFCADNTEDRRRFAESSERNKGPILEVLKRVLPERGLVLEIGSGTGRHAAHFAPLLPGITWQPSDRDPDSIDAWAQEARGRGLPAHGRSASSRLADLESMALHLRQLVEPRLRTSLPVPR